MSQQWAGNRWSDERIETFYQEFRAHIAQEGAEAAQQSEIHAALFQLEDRNRNVPPGVIQLLSQLNERTKEMEIVNDRQKRFIGGFLFAFTCIGFFFTDTAHKVVGFVKGL